MQQSSITHYRQIFIPQYTNTGQLRIAICALHPDHLNDNLFKPWQIKIRK